MAETVNAKAEEDVRAEDTKKQMIIQKTYFDVLGLCCSSEVVLVERILTSLEGVKDVSVIVASKTVIVVHDSAFISPLEIAKALNQARLEANVRVNGRSSYRKKWPNLYVIACGLLLGLSFLKYVYSPLRWLAVLAVGVGIWPIIMRGIAAVKNLTLDVNILVIIAVAGTLALKDFWEAGTIVFLFTIAEWLQSRASHEANAVMSSLMSIAPQQATIADTGELVNVEDVKLGTILSVKTGEVIPIDGLVVEGNCEVDEKALTGEAFPVSKQKDSSVWAGTINVNGYISVKTNALPEDCVVAKMAKLVEEAQNKKPRFERLVDEFAKYYTPAVVLLSVGLAAVPAAMRVENVSHWFHLALVVLVSACPCGLILSTPVATFCALSKAASSGLLIKGGDYIETLSKVKTLAFDKTGTITRGEFIMNDFRCLSDDIRLDTLIYWVSSIERKSSHPIAEAFIHYGKSQAIEPKPEIVEEFQNFPGEGVAGKIDGRTIYVGNRKLSQRAGCLAFPETESISEVDGRTLGYVYSGGAVIGSFSLSDACRSGSLDAIKDLKSMGIRTAMLTGDSNAAATHAHDQLDRTLDEIHAELLPEDKARIVEEYKKSGPTAMVGDGVNDAPALATADVGISMGVSGSALASETGHVILMSNDIRRIPKAIRLARRTQHKVIQNIVFSVATKAVVLAAAFAGHPIVWLAVLADVLTCLLVILNSMLLLRGSRGHHHHHHHHHNHSHVHGKSGACDGSLASNHHVHDHEGSCHSSGVHKHHCKSNNIATRRCKAAKCEEHSTSCRSRKCDVDPLVHRHQHNAAGSVKARECSSSQGCNGSVDECCESQLTSQSGCHNDKYCRDLEGQVAGCLVNQVSSSSSKPDDSSCQHQNECCVDQSHHHGVSVDHDDHDHTVADHHKHACVVGMASRDISCCKSFIEECCRLHGHSPARVHLAAGIGGGLTEILSDLSDACRSGSLDAIKDLKSMGIRTAMLTGDSNAAATHAHDQLDRTLDEIHAELLPEDKARIVEEYKKSGPTAMVDDGVNDAPALATADVGISMGVSGSALASETGHVILMSNDIRRIPKAIRLARRTQHKVIQNIVFSVATKAVVLAAAFAGHPIVWLAVLADVLTCLLVILNSMLLLRGSRGHHHHHHHHHNHSHVHGKSGACDGSLASNHHVHDHEGSCHSSGVHKHHCKSNNIATRRCKAAKCEEHSTSCRSRKCDVDPLVHRHQHNAAGSVKARECSSSQGCNGSVDECCESQLTSQSGCHNDKYCRDLEGQVAGCLVNQVSSSSSKPDDSSCQHQNECCVDQSHHHGVSVDHDDHDHTVADHHKHACVVGMASRDISCCKSFIEECCRLHGHSPARVHLAAGIGGGLTEILSE